MLAQQIIERDVVYEAAYVQLQQLARRERRRRQPQGSLNTTALVHEAWLKLRNHPEIAQLPRAHFLALSARAMRQILIDCARRQHAEKRQHVAVTFDDNVESQASMSVDVLALDAALTRLEAMDARLAQVVDMHVFGGFEFADIAQAQGVSERSVYRLWREARVFLLDQITP
ncbi:MAG: ECF-type sigma factor [Xanthomonadales bacterium]|nr:ECF-type sigma factor [Xanthomonadales bacterium]